MTVEGSLTPEEREILDEFLEKAYKPKKKATPTREWTPEEKAALDDFVVDVDISQLIFQKPLLIDTEIGGGTDARVDT